MFSGVVCSLILRAVLPPWGLLRNVTSGSFLEADQLRGKINFLSAALCVWAPRYRELSMKSATSRKKHFRPPPPKLPTAKSRKRRGGSTAGVGFASRLSNIGGEIIGLFMRNASWCISGWISFASSFLCVKVFSEKKDKNTAPSRQHLAVSESIRVTTVETEIPSIHNVRQISTKAARTMRHQIFNPPSLPIWASALYCIVFIHLGINNNWIKLQWLISATVIFLFSQKWQKVFYGFKKRKKSSCQYSCSAK